MTKLLIPEAFCETSRSLFPGWGQGQGGDSLAWDIHFCWAFSPLRIYCAPKHKLFLCLKDFDFCQCQFSLADSVSLLNTDPNWSQNHTFDQLKVFFKFQSCFIKTVFKPQGLLKIQINTSHDKILCHLIQHLMIKLLLDCCEMCEKILNKLSWLLTWCL